MWERTLSDQILYKGRSIIVSSVIFFIISKDIINLKLEECFTVTLWDVSITKVYLHGNFNASVNNSQFIYPFTKGYSIIQNDPVHFENPPKNINKCRE